jgi:outer membrane lipoprotein-sorting protein
MSTSPQVPPPDDPVARATDALRRAPVPDGPPPETIARTLAALRAAAEGPGAIPRPRRRIMLAMLKMAAAVLVAAAGVSYFALPPAPATAEFVEAATKLQQARTLSFRQSITISGIPMPMNARILYKVPGLVRSEHELAAAGVSVLDLIHGKSLLLVPADKSALQMDVPPAGGNDPARRRDPSAAMIEDMRQLAQKNGEPAGERVIGGVRARGFRVKEQGQDMTVWVDPQKKVPLLVEFSGRIGTLEFHGSFADIQLDPQLDDTLFRLDPPEGYKLRKLNAKLDMTNEEAVARHLRSYTEASGGRFPARLDDFADWQKVVLAAAKKKAPTEQPKGKGSLDFLNAEAFESAVASGRVAMMCQQMKDRYGYKPDGVKLGDAKAIVFWYKPEGQDKYKAVYGDLHIGEVTEAELPK